LGISPPVNIGHGADGVIRTAMKSCIHKHPTYLDQRSLKPPKPFHGGSSDNIGCRDQIRRLGYSFAERTDLCYQHSLWSVEKFSGGIIATGEQFIAVVVETLNNLSPVSTTTAITFVPGVIDTSQK
jgi:hypothetical protein